MADRVGQHLGEYRLVRLLGKGGFAEVYLGEHLQEKTFAAVKVLQTRIESSEDLMKGFIKEASAFFRLKHPNIVQLLGFDITTDDIPFLVMEYAPNGTLRQRHPFGTRLPLATVVSYVTPVAAALQYAHNKGLIHRDVKPENMLLGSHNEVLLSDFGIATIAHRTTTMRVEAIAGTALYMAPEVFEGKPRPSSDQYSLGIVIYEWLTGAPPFTVGNFIQLGYQHTHILPPPLHEKNPSISPMVNQVVLTALKKDPHQRFATVQAFANALEQAYQAEQELAAAPTLRATPPAPGVPPTIQPTIAASPSLAPPAPTLTVSPTQEEEAPAPIVTPPKSSPLPVVSEAVSPPAPPFPKSPGGSEQKPEPISSPLPTSVDTPKSQSPQPVRGREVDYDTSQLVQGKALTIFYQGSLSASNQVYLHWGKNGWRDVGRGDEPMVKGPDGRWQTSMNIPADATQINLAFHNESGSWDNNGGKDWNLPIRAVTPPSPFLAGSSPTKSAAPSAPSRSSQSPSSCMSWIVFFIVLLVMGSGGIWWVFASLNPVKDDPYVVIKVVSCIFFFGLGVICIALAIDSSKTSSNLKQRGVTVDGSITNRRISGADYYMTYSFQSYGRRTYSREAEVKKN